MKIRNGFYCGEHAVNFIEWIKTEIRSALEKRIPVDGELDLTDLLEFIYKNRKCAKLTGKLCGTEKDDPAAYDRAYGELVKHLRSDIDSIIDLGPGDGKKCAYFYRKTKAKDVVLVDVSRGVLGLARKNLEGIVEAYSVNKRFTELRREDLDCSGNRIFLLLGNTLSNFGDQPRQELVSHLNTVMDPGDELVIEVDYEKDVKDYDNKGTKDFFSTAIGDFLTPSEHDTFKVVGDERKVRVSYSVEQPKAHLRPGDEITFYSGSMSPEELCSTASCFQIKYKSIVGNDILAILKKEDI